MRRRARWVVAFLVGTAFAIWLAAAIYPDRIFSAYLQTRRWLAAAGPIQKLPTPSVIAPDGIHPAQQPALKGFVVIPATAAMWIAKSGTWEPTKTEIHGLEVSLPQVSTLKAENWSTTADIRIEHPEQYFRQYVAVVRGGKRLIYINAFCDQIRVSSLRQRLVVIMGGGTCCWQAFYDPATAKFLSLRINGVA